MNVLYFTDAGPVDLLLVKGILDIFKNIWSKPVSSQASTEKLDNLVTEVFPSRQRTDLHSAVLDKEGHKLDILGWRHTSGALGLCIAKFKAIVGYLMLWKGRSQYTEGTKNPRWLKVLQAEGIRLGKEELNVSCQVADSCSQAMISAVVGSSQKSCVCSSHCSITTCVVSQLANHPCETSQMTWRWKHGYL